MVKDDSGHSRYRRPFRVLIVDDNRDAADSLAMLIRLWGHEAQTAYGGGAGLELASAFSPDCCLLDISMPDMDGYAVARRIRSRPEFAGAKLVALSAYSSEEHRRRALEAGFDHCFVKPADPSALEGLLTMLLQALRLAERTEALAEKNVQIAEETKELLTEVKEEIKDVKEELKEVKEELREIKKASGES